MNEFIKLEDEDLECVVGGCFFDRDTDTLTLMPLEKEILVKAGIIGNETKKISFETAEISRKYLLDIFLDSAEVRKKLGWPYAHCISGTPKSYGSNDEINVIVDTEGKIIEHKVYFLKNFGLQPGAL